MILVICRQQTQQVVHNEYDHANLVHQKQPRVVSLEGQWDQTHHNAHHHDPVIDPAESVSPVRHLDDLIQPLSHPYPSFIFQEAASPSRENGSGPVPAEHLKCQTPPPMASETAPHRHWNRRTSGRRLPFAEAALSARCRSRPPPPGPRQCGRRLPVPPAAPAPPVPGPPGRRGVFPHPGDCRCGPR